MGVNLSVFNENCRVSGNDCFYMETGREAGGLSCSGYFVFCSVFSGRATVRKSGGDRTFIFGKGDIMVLSPSMSVEVGEMSSDLRLAIFWMAGTFFDSLSSSQRLFAHLAAYVDSSSVPLFHLDKAAFSSIRTASVMFGSICSSMTDREGMARNLCNFYILLVSDRLYRSSGVPSARIPHSRMIFRNFMKLLLANFRTEHNLAFYAGRLSVSTAYLSRIVRQTTGHTVHYHISEHICAEARHMLSNTDLDIKQISDRLGFSDQSVFGKYFSRKTGMSPSSYRGHHSKEVK